MKTERWKTYPLDARYEVSSQGRVRNRATGFVRKPVLIKNGYATVAFSSPRCLLYVHRMVLVTFKPTKKAGVEASHLDGCRTNNALANLAWETRKRNNQRKVSHATDFRGERNPMAKLSASQVTELRTTKWGRLSYAKIGERFGVTRETVRRVILRGGWVHA